MATIIERSDGRFELRESRWTEKGPRSRTLAIFRILTDDVLDIAESRATRPFDRKGVTSRAEELGLYVRRVLGTRDAATVIARAQSGAMWPTHVRAVQESLTEVETEPLPGHLEPMIRWIGVDDFERGRTVAELLGLAHAIMRHREPSRTEPLQYPKLRRS